MIGSFVHRQGDTAAAPAADVAHAGNPFAMAALYLGSAAAAAVEVDAPASVAPVAEAVAVAITTAPPVAAAPASSPEIASPPTGTSGPGMHGTNALLAQFYANGTLRVVVGDQERLISPHEALLFSMWLVQHTTARIRSGHA